jgi:cell division protein FtsB
MKRAYNLLLLLRSASVPALSFAIIAFFGGYALFGSNGVLAWGEYTNALHQRQIVLLQTQQERSDLSNRVTLLDPRHANPDIVDELVRRNLGVAGKDEVILPLR